MADDVQFKSFARARPKIEFDCGPDAEVFEAYPVMPPTQLQEMLNIIKRVRSVGTDDTDRAAKSFQMMEDFFQLILRDESYTRFQKKLQDKENGVQIDELMEVFQWLIERYGLRPSQSPNSSSDGSPSGVGGSSSMDGASREGSDPSS